MTTENIGEIVIAPRVLEVITGIAATKVEGVYALKIKMLRIVSAKQAWDVVFTSEQKKMVL